MKRNFQKQLEEQKKISRRFQKIVFIMVIATSEVQSSYVFYHCRNFIPCSWVRQSSPILRSASSVSEERITYIVCQDFQAEDLNLKISVFCVSYCYVTIILPPLCQCIFVLSVLLCVTKIKYLGIYYLNFENLSFTQVLYTTVHVFYRTHRLPLYLSKISS